MSAMINRLRPAVNSEAITKSDTVGFTRPCDSIYVGTGGDVVVVHPAGNTTTFPDVPSGFVLPVYAKRVNSTDTTASGMVALFSDT